MRHDGCRAMLHESLLVPAPIRLQATRAHWWLLSFEVSELIDRDPDLHLVEVKTYLTRGIRTYTFEGDRLPAWKRGNDPMSLPTLEAFRQYRLLRRIYDIRWPGDVEMSSSIVWDILNHAGRPADLASEVTFTGRQRSHIVDPDLAALIHSNLW